MKKRGNNKSQAGLITTIILIMIVLVSIIIVWNIVFAILNNSSSQTGVDQFSNTVNIESVKLLINGDLEVKVKKGSGNSTTNSLQFNVFDSTGAAYSITLNNTNLNALETKSYILNASNIKASNKIKTVSVYPALGNKLGMEAPAYDSALNKDSSGNLIPEIPTNPSSIGLVSWWKFDGDMKDSAGNNYGNCNSCPTPTIDNKGNANSAYKFNGVNSNINLSNNNPIRNSDNYTISVWTNITAIPTGIGINEILVYYGNFVIRYYNDAKFYFYVYRGCTDSSCALPPQVSSTNTYGINQWHNIIVTYDKNAGINNMKMYINGVSAGSSTTPTTNSNNMITEYMYLGSWRGIAAPVFMNGSIDNLMIFNKSLNADEIKAIYNNQK